MNKIIEKIVEPSKVTIGSTFLLKIKAIRYLTYRELRNKNTYTEVKDFKYSCLKGD